MPTSTYEKIDSRTLASATGTIDFTSIPQTYTDIFLITNHFYTATDQIQVRVGNGSIDTGSNYSSTSMQGTGTNPATSGRQTSSSFIYGIFGTSGNDGNSFLANFMNYSNTNTYKSILTRGNAMGDSTNEVIGLWRNTVAINTIRIYLPTTTFKVGSTFTLYGIKAA